MGAIFAFVCKSCGRVHEGSPSFGFDAPYQYASLSEEQKAAMSKLTSDFCTITHDEGTDRFIRTVLEIPIIGVAEPFVWGVWVSLSEKSYSRYVDTYDDPLEGEVFFGWVCNTLPYYPPGGPLGANVVVQLGRQRPKLLLRTTEDPAHPLVIDQREGITVARAQEIAEIAMHGT